MYRPVALMPQGDVYINGVRMYEVSHYKGTVASLQGYDRTIGVRQANHYSGSPVCLCVLPLFYLLNCL